MSGRPGTTGKKLTEKERNAAYQRKYYATHRDKERERLRKYYIVNRDKVRERRRKYHITNRDKERARQRAYYVGNTEKRMLAAARIRARKYDIPCTITTADIIVPERCPLLGVVLETGIGGVSPNSPSLDRIIPHLGYVPGNVLVISNRANIIKNDANLSELKLLTKNLEKILDERLHRRNECGKS